MSGFTMAQAKRDFSIGYLTKYKITRWPMSDDWAVYLGQGNSQGWLTDVRTKGPRKFKTLDAAVSALKQIGFEINELQ